MKKSIKFAMIFAALIIVITLAVNLFGSRIKLEMVQHGEMEKSFSFDAIVIRNETLINSAKTGVLESLVKDGEVVRKNKHVASIYESETDDEIKTKLSAVNSRIEEINKASVETSGLAMGAYRLESTMDLRVSEITAAMEDGNMAEVISVKNELNLLNDKKNTLENGDDYTQAMLSKLMEEKREYESALGDDKQDLYSPVSGIYSTGVDGFEEIVTSDAIGDMTPYDFESVYKMKNSDDTAKGAVCKIIDNSEWSVAFLASEKEIQTLKEGSTVYIRTNGSAEDSAANISYISTPVNGNYLVAATSDVSCEWANKERFVTIDLVRSKYKGLKVPVKALRVKDNITGVYTVVDGIVHFKKVKVLYKDSNFAIVEENNASQGGLLLYDEVVVSSGKSLKEGQRIS